MPVTGSNHLTKCDLYTILETVGTTFMGSAS